MGLVLKGLHLKLDLRDKMLFRLLLERSGIISSCSSQSVVAVILPASISGTINLKHILKKCSRLAWCSGLFKNKTI